MRFKFFSLALLFISCSKPTDPPKIEPLLSQESHSYQVYRDTHYPFSLRYPIDLIEVLQPDPEKLDKDRGWHVSMYLDLRHDTGPDSTENASWRYGVRFYVSPETFLKEISKYSSYRLERAPEEIAINNVLMLHLSYDVEKAWQWHAYIPLVPGTYVIATLSWSNNPPDAWAEEPPNPEYQKKINLLNQVVQTFEWHEPIDQSSQEFKDWKAHIFSLIEKARQDQRESKTDVKK